MTKYDIKKEWQTHAKICAEWLNDKYVVHLVLHPHGIAFVVAGSGFYSYYIHQGNKSDKERNTKRCNTVF